MCGIAGILYREPAEQTLLQAQLARLQSAVRHRGPDDQGAWLCASGLAGLAHVRLSILDLSPSGHQPMVHAAGRYTIVFNGEIYNYRELREQLVRDGDTFRGGSDTEVLLALYVRHGTAMLGMLRGMYAFAIWDEVARSCFLARDPFGIKPLYYTHTSDGRLAFASEVRALQNAGFAGDELEPAAVLRFLRQGSVGEPHTLLKNVWVLPAGSHMSWKDGRIEIRSFWSPVFQPERGMDAVDAVAKTRDALLDSLQHHFVSDVPVGIFLSGGIDSTVLLALATQLGHRDLATFSVGVDDPALDETSIALRTARHFGSRHHETRLDGSQGTQALTRYMEHLDQPSIDGFNTFVVSEFARQHGMKVVLSGLGGDELFAGYPSFSKVPQLFRWSRNMHILPGVGRVAGGVLELFGRTPRLRRLGALFKHQPGMIESYRCFRGIFPERDARKLASRLCGLEEKSLPATLPYTPFQAVDERDAVSALELTGYMRHQLLHDSDVMSMAHGLELRVPFVDARLFDTLSRIPASIRLQTGKKLLLQAVPEVPEWVASQPKRGFLFPYEKWMQEDWRRTFEDISRELPGSRPTWYQKWALFMLRQWSGRSGVSLCGTGRVISRASDPRPTSSPLHFWVPGIREGSGGIQGFCRDVVHALKQSFPERSIHVLVKNDSPDHGDALFSDGRVTWSTAEQQPARLRTAVFAWKGLVAGVFGRPAVVLSGHVNFLPAVRLLKKLRGAPYACFMYGIDVWEPLSAAKRAALKQADLLCSISRHTTARAVEAQGLDASCVAAFPCTLNADRYTPGPKPTELLQRYGLRPEQPVLFTVSRLAASERYKGHEQVLQALGKVAERKPDVRYLIGGTGDYKETLQGIASRAGMADRVIFAGYIPNEELRAHYQLCDVFVMPSRGEGFGIVFVEAAACGRPAIGGNQDGSVDALADGRIGVLVNPADTDEIATAITQVLEKSHANRLLFDPTALSAEAKAIFGPEAFQERLHGLLSPLLARMA